MIDDIDSPNGSEIHYDKKLDASGLACPLPLLKMKQALNGMDSGQVLYVIATDAGSVRDFEAFSKQSSHSIDQFEQREGSFHYWIRKQ